MKLNVNDCTTIDAPPPSASLRKCNCYEFSRMKTNKMIYQSNDAILNLPHMPKSCDIYSNTRYSCHLINRRQFNKVSYIFHVQHLHRICHDKIGFVTSQFKHTGVDCFPIVIQTVEYLLQKKWSLCSQIFSGKWQFHLGKHLKWGRTEPPNTSRSCHVPLHFLLRLKFVVVFCLVLVLSWFTDFVAKLMRATCAILRGVCSSIATHCLFFVF